MSALAVQGTGLKAVDSLSANEFAVELDGERVDGIFRVSGLVTFKLETKATTALKPLKEPFKVVKMVQRNPNAPFNNWLRETVTAKADIVRPTRTLVIIAVDDGVEIRRWTVNGAWISEIGYSEFNTGSGELVEEHLTIQWDTIDESWPAG
ncbi:MAG: phage tail protein [Anaerolineae bacterium]|nr:phage tail protein [Anaerolineae bacterium]